MKLKLTRRRFAQLMIASTAVTGLGYLGKNTYAQTSSMIYGVRADRQAGGLVLQSLNLATQKIEDIATVSIELGEQLNSLTYLAANTFLLTINPIRTGKKENDPSRLVTVVMGQISSSVSIPELKKEEILQSVLVTNDGSVIGLVHKKDKKSATLVNIDVKTGTISTIDKIKLSKDERFDNLAQSNEIIYTTTLGLQGDTSLRQLDLTKGQVSQGVQLKIDGTVWNSGFSSLASASGDIIYGLGNKRYNTPNNLYTINVSTGAMTLLQQWDVVKITTNVSSLMGNVGGIFNLL
ncbi:MAG: hypothetical protein HC862_28905 [Scytonema sp. RU_4_4]|nr:hypothetical protein [Scytonema sp. RU_4_4]